MRFAAALLSLIVFNSFAFAQWLPEADQQRYRAIWDSTGVTFPEGAKFYKLKRVSQRLVKVVQSGEFNSNRGGIYDANYQGSENINQQYPWVTPAGLHWAPKSQWTKIALARFPGPILVWNELTPVKNSFGSYQDEIQTSWQFPEGTLFAEMLMRQSDDGREIAFEIRERMRGRMNWFPGVTYRPWVSRRELPAGSVRYTWRLPAGKLEDFGVGTMTVRGWELPPMPLEPMPLTPSNLLTTATHDQSIIPRGYMGNVTGCMTCHDKTGRSTSYGATNIPGSDSVISWTPFTMETLNRDRDPKFDRRWGLKIIQP